MPKFTSWLELGDAKLNDTLDELLDMLCNYACEAAKEHNYSYPYSLRFMNFSLST